MANDERDAEFVQLINRFDKGMGDHLADLKVKVGDEDLVADAAAIVATAAALAADLQRVRAGDLVLDDVLDRSGAGWQEAGRSIATVAAAQQFVEGLSVTQVGVEEKAQVLLQAVREDRKRQAQEDAARAAEQQETARQQVAVRRQALEELRRQRDALDAGGVDPDGNDQELPEVDRELLDINIGLEEAYLRGDEAEVEVRISVGSFHTAGETMAELFYEGYGQITAGYAKTRRAAARRRQRAQWLRQARYLGYLAAGVVVGQVVAPSSPIWSLVVAFVLLGADQLLIKPRLDRFEAGKRNLELQHDVFVTALIWLRLRSLQTAVQFWASSAQVPWEPFVPMTPFAAGREALGMAVDPNAPGKDVGL